MVKYSQNLLLKVGVTGMNGGFDLWKTIVNKEKSENTDEDFKKQDFELKTTKFNLKLLSVVTFFCLLVVVIIANQLFSQNDTEEVCCSKIYTILDSEETNYDYQNRIKYIRNFYKSNKNIKCKRLELLDDNYFLARIYQDLANSYINRTKMNWDKYDYYTEIARKYFYNSIAKFDFSKNSNQVTDTQFWDYHVLGLIDEKHKDYEKQINRVNFYYDNFGNNKSKDFAHLDRNAFLSEIYTNLAKSIQEKDINKAIELQKKAIHLLATSNAEYYKRNNSNNKYYMIAPKYLQLNNYYFKNKQYSEALISIDFASTNLLKAGGDPSWFESNRCKVYWAMGYEGSAKTYCEYAYKVLSKLIYEHKKFNAKIDDGFINEYNIVNSIYRQIQNRNDLAMQYSVNRNNNNDDVMENEGFNCSKCYPKDKLSEEFKQTDEFIEGCSDCYYYAEHQK